MTSTHPCLFAMISLAYLMNFEEQILSKIVQHDVTTSDILHPNQLAPQPHHTDTTPTPQPFKVSVVRLWCGCGVARTTTAPQPHHTTGNFKRLWCWCGCGAVVVRAGLNEGCHLWATVSCAVGTKKLTFNLTFKRIRWILRA